MPVVVRTNMPSIIVQQNLNAATNSLNTAIERMTTGYKINQASDNAANFSIATSWVTKIGSLDVVAENTAMAQDMLTTSEKNYDLITTHLQRIRDLTEQAANGTYGVDSLKAMQSEIVARLEEITRVAKNAEFNGIELMTGSVGTAGLNIQVGLDATPDSVINLAASMFSDASVCGLFASNTTFMNIVKKDNNNQAVNPVNNTNGYTAVAAAFVGLKKDGSGNYSIQTETGYQAKDTLATLDKALKNIDVRVTTLGSTQNRIDSAATSIEVRSENLTSSLSTIRDTDVAKESSNYIQAQILQQASATLLATANQAPSIALSLI